MTAEPDLSDTGTATQHRETLERWRFGIRVLHIGHGMAGEAFDKWGRVSGVASAVMSSIAGTAIFASLSASTRTEFRVATGLASLVAAGLSTAQLIWNYPQLAQRHKHAATKYGLLRRTADRMLVGAAVPSTRLEDVSRAWEQIEETAPPLPERFRRRSREMMDIADARHAPPPAGRALDELPLPRASSEI